MQKTELAEMIILYKMLHDFVLFFNYSHKIAGNHTVVCIIFVSFLVVSLTLKKKKNIQVETCGDRTLGGFEGQTCVSFDIHSECNVSVGSH